MMKRSSAKIILLLLAVLAVLLVFSGCSSTVQCEKDSLTDAVKRADKFSLSACVYSDGEDILMLPGGDELADFIQGDWKARSGKGDGDKVLSVTVSTQYEVCFFDNGTAMIYYGYCGVFEKDRQYFDVSLNTGLDALVDYVNNTGIVIKYDIKSFTDAVEKTDKASAFTSNDDNAVELTDGKTLAAFMRGDWEKRSDKGTGEKLLSIELPMQYGVSFFDDDTAMIYCNELKKGKQYFDVTLDTDLYSLVEYVEENGTVVDSDKKGAE